MSKLIKCFALALTLPLAACATVTRGTTSDVQIISEPSDATARISNGFSCQTPCTYKVSRKEEFVVTISKDGYEEATVAVKTQVAGTGAAGFAGNILVGGIVGMGADAMTGAALEHIPNPVSVSLKAISKAKKAVKKQR
jgi:PEGA domain